jgi:hypothetical protein
MTKKIAVEPGEGGIVALSDYFVKDSLVEDRLYRFENRVVVENAEMIAGYKKPTVTETDEIFSAAYLLEDNVAILHHLFKMPLSDTVGDFSAYSG